MSNLDKLFKRLDLLLDRVEKMVPTETVAQTEPGFSAYRWAAGSLVGIPHFNPTMSSSMRHPIVAT